MTARKRDPRVAARPPWQDQLDALAAARREQEARAKAERQAQRRAKKRLTPKQARLAEIEQVLENERKWDELRATRRALWQPSGCGDPSPEAIEVFRRLYAGRSGTRGLLSKWRDDAMRYGDGRLDLGYRVPGKVT
jgi:hypothetical protein